jgi:hypothetical protein
MPHLLVKIVLFCGITAASSILLALPYVGAP